MEGTLHLTKTVIYVTFPKGSFLDSCCHYRDIFQAQGCHYCLVKCTTMEWLPEWLSFPDLVGNALWLQWYEAFCPQVLSLTVQCTRGWDVENFKLFLKSFQCILRGGGAYLDLGIRLDYETMAQEQRNISERKVISFLSPGKPGQQVAQYTMVQKQNQSELVKFLVGTERTKSTLVWLGLEYWPERRFTPRWANNAGIPHDNYRRVCSQVRHSHWSPR